MKSHTISGCTCHCGHPPCHTCVDLVQTEDECEAFDAMGEDGVFKLRELLENDKSAVVLGDSQPAVMDRQAITIETRNFTG